MRTGPSENLSTPQNMSEFIRHPLVRDIFDTYGYKVVNFILIQSFVVFMLEAGILSLIITHPHSVYDKIPVANCRPFNRQIKPGEEAKENFSQSKASNLKRKHPENVVHLRSQKPCKKLKMNNNIRTSTAPKLVGSQNAGPENSRWITPSQQIVEKILAARSKFSKKAAAPSNLKTYHFVQIVPDSEFQPAYIRCSKKEYCKQTSGTPLPPRCKGLRLPPELEKSLGIEFLLVVFTITETCAKEYGLRVKLKKRHRKKRVKNLLVSSNNSGLIVSSGTSEESQAKKFGATAEQLSNIQASPFLLDCHYDPTMPLNTRKILYNRCSRNTWPPSHILNRLENISDLTKCARLLVKQIIDSHKIGQLVLPDVSEHVHLLKSMVEPFIAFNKRYRNLHGLLKSCCAFSKRKGELKASREKDSTLHTAQENGTLANVAITGPETCSPDLIDLTIESTTTASSEDSFHASSHELKANSNGNSQNKGSISADHFKSSGSGSNPIVESPALGPTKKFVIKNVQDVSHNSLMLALKQILHMNGLEKLLGCESNRKGFFKFVRRSIFIAGTKSALKLAQLVETMDFRKVPWLDSVHNEDVKLYLFVKVVSWIYSEYVLMLIRSSFYVTEVSNRRNQVHFFWRDAWNSASDRQRNHNLKNAVFRQLCPEELVQAQSNLNIRFIPKPKDDKTHFRMLTKRMYVSTV